MATIKKPLPLTGPEFRAVLVGLDMAEVVFQGDRLEEQNRLEQSAIAVAVEVIRSLKETISEGMDNSQDAEILVSMGERILIVQALRTLADKISLNNPAPHSEEGYYIADQYRMLYENGLLGNEVYYSLGGSLLGARGLGDDEDADMPEPIEIVIWLHKIVQSI